MKAQATAGFAAAVGALETPLEAITGAKEREEERAKLHDLGAALAQATARLDQIEHDYGARLDKFSDRIDDASSSKFADIAARLDRLEQKTAAPAAPASQLADVTTRLDKLEKSGLLSRPRPPPNLPISRRGSTSSKRKPPSLRRLRLMARRGSIRERRGLLSQR